MDVSEAKRLKTLEDQNTKLKRLLADAMLDNAALKDLLGKNVWSASSVQGRLPLPVVSPLRLRTPAITSSLAIRTSCRTASTMSSGVAFRCPRRR